MRRFTVILAACVSLLCAFAWPALGATRVSSTRTVVTRTVVVTWRVQLAVSEARQFWEIRGSAILASFHSGGSSGQCTEIAAARRPDIIARVDLWAYTQAALKIPPGAPPVVRVNWLAKEWARDARLAGMPIGHRPRRGAVMVFQPGALGADAGGHVAVVDSVGRDGAFTISEEHAPVLGVVTKSWFGAGAARAIARDRRISFIYR